MNITEVLANNEKYKDCYIIDNDGFYVQTNDLWLKHKGITSLNKFKQNTKFGLWLNGNPIVTKYTFYVFTIFPDLQIRIVRGF